MAERCDKEEFPGHVSSACILGCSSCVGAASAVAQRTWLLSGALCLVGKQSRSAPAAAECGKQPDSSLRSLLCLEGQQPVQLRSLSHIHISNATHLSDETLRLVGGAGRGAEGRGRQLQQQPGHRAVGPGGQLAALPSVQLVIVRPLSASLCGA